MKILITGTASFIGYHFAEKLIRKDHIVIGLDHINDYYDKDLKFDRLSSHSIARSVIATNKLVKSDTFDNYQYIRADLQDKEIVLYHFNEHDLM